MILPPHKSFIETRIDDCRMCYSCVRDCPAKAIRIVDGQAEIIPERCISCGNCVRVCSQHAKYAVSTIGQVEDLLKSGSRVAACIAPSFPAEFSELDYGKIVGMIRALGFDLVTEVAFGADLVAAEYRKLLEADTSKRFISTPCPAIISFVEKYHPEALEYLAPIVSPMIAMARVLHRLYDDDLKIVFIGPCIAKKCEASSANLEQEVSVSITFAELREMFIAHDLKPEDVSHCEFDPPKPSLGGLFPLSRGLLQAANLHEDLILGDVVNTDGRTRFIEAIREFEMGSMDARFLEILACNGCIMGAGMSTRNSLFTRRSDISKYVKKQREVPLTDADLQMFEELKDVDLYRKFTANDQRLAVPFKEELAQILARMGKKSTADELNCGACGYDTCQEHAVAIFKGLAETEMCLPNIIETLKLTVKKLHLSNEQLADTQEALMHSEKLASMGQLAAGIAHEVNNPLGVVLMYSHLLLDQQNMPVETLEDVKMIAEQADRCKKIVGGLLHFARQNKVVFSNADITDLLDSVVELHCNQSNVNVVVEHNMDNKSAEIDSDQIIQVFTNLVNNAQHAMTDGGTLTINSSGDQHNIKVMVSDTGTGIAKENISKLFEPFFTTKQIGEGTGLGLAVTYGIVKMHHGNIQVQSNDDPGKGPTGTTFTVILPRKKQQAS
ncbi:MAG: 4Fe-4S dicluster domain-containing protein [Phycisphaerae bacterium]|nr:4Fe-4S dicluster domain-containing protein [Phycisphaerae bacterium]